MHNPIAVLEKRGIDVRTHLGAVQDARAFNWTNGKQYRDAIAELAGDVSEFGAFDDLTAKFFYLYLVENVVKRHNNESNISAENIVSESMSSALKMNERIRTGDFAYLAKLEDNAALLAGTVIGEDGEVIVVRSGRKGEKKDRALDLYKANSKLSRNEMIELFMKELDMSKAGATTYVYNCKKEIEA